MDKLKPETAWAIASDKWIFPWTIASTRRDAIRKLARNSMREGEADHYKAWRREQRRSNLRAIRVQITEIQQ